MKPMNPQALLKEMYKRHGRIRKQISSRKRKESKAQTYKKGYEIRIVVKEDEVQGLVEAMKALGIKNGNPYRKGMYKVVPIYGKLRTEAFMKEIVKVRSASARPRLASRGKPRGVKPPRKA